MAWDAAGEGAVTLELAVACAATQTSAFLCSSAGHDLLMRRRFLLYVVSNFICYLGVVNYSELEERDTTKVASIKLLKALKAVRLVSVG